MELLCPAGSFESLKAAVNNGTDAVYFGGSSFNARRSAKSPGNLEEAVRYCHIRSCKVYFTLNTLVLDREFKAFLELAYEAAKSGVDAFIAQDLGAGYALKKEFPEIPVHASTQMTVTNSYAAKTLEKLGYERIILARELTREEIKEINRKVNIPIEAFAHGAICEGYSGQCLFSNFLGGRSANRGECAQPCRLKYEIGGKSGHLLSAKDLCLIKYIKELEECGVSSLKIEGRLKRAEYVALVARTYRRAIDGAEITDADIENLKAVFNRGEFTVGRFGGDNDRLYPLTPGHIGAHLGKITKAYRQRSLDIAEIKTSKTVNAGDIVLCIGENAEPRTVKRAEHIKDGYKLYFDQKTGFTPGAELRLVYDKELIEELFLSDNTRKKPLNADVEIETGNNSRLKITDGEGREASVYGNPAEKAVKRAVSEDEIKAQISKTGDYPFYFESVTVKSDGDAAFSKSALNKLRRSGLNEYINLLTEPRKVNPPDFELLNKLKSAPPRKILKPKLSAYVSCAEQARAVKDLVDIIYFPAADAENFNGIKNAVPALAPVLSDNEIKRALPVLDKYKSALLTTLIPFGGEKIADYTFNITNLLSMRVLYDSGYSRAVLSPELTAPQIRDLTYYSSIETEAIVYGKINLMITANCPVNCGGSNCKIEAGNVFLKDRLNKKFLLRRVGEDCRVSLINSVPIFMADKINEVHADVLRLIFTDKTPDKCAEIIETYRDALNGKSIKTLNGEFTRGHYYRGFSKYE